MDGHACEAQDAHGAAAGEEIVKATSGGCWRTKQGSEHLVPRLGEQHGGDLTASANDLFRNDELQRMRAGEENALAREDVLALEQCLDAAGGIYTG